MCNLIQYPLEIMFLSLSGITHKIVKAVSDHDLLMITLKSSIEGFGHRMVRVVHCVNHVVATLNAAHRILD